MNYVYFYTPTTNYLRHTGNYESCMQYVKENMNQLTGWGYYLIIRDAGGNAIKKIGSRILPMQ